MGQSLTSAYTTDADKWMTCLSGRLATSEAVPTAEYKGCSVTEITLLHQSNPKACVHENKQRQSKSLGTSKYVQ